MAAFSGMIHSSAILMFTLFTLAARNTDGLYFRGGENAYATLESWVICSTSRLSFEFRTDRTEGLLLYQDDGGYSDYLVVSLLNTSLSMDLKLMKGRVLSFSVGSQLDDMKWHKVTIQRDYQTTSLILDGVYQKWTANFADVQFGELLGKPSNLFVGGIPTKYEANLSCLSHPPVYFSTRYTGEIKNISYHNCTEETVPNILTFDGVVAKRDRKCNSICQNGGLCFVRERRDVCDCSLTDYTGTLCDQAKADRNATFSGSEYISYNFTEKDDMSLQHQTEEIVFDFKTESGDGLLFFTGDGKYFINIGLMNGQLYIGSYMSDGKDIQHRKVGGSNTFDDNRWHTVTVKRKVTKVYAYVDNEEYEAKWTTTGNFTDITSRVMFVGGAPDVRQLNGSKATQNFFGCLRAVRFKADSVHLNILQQSPLFTTSGNIRYNECSKVDLAQPITILFPENYLRLPRIEDTGNSILTISFKTTERNGLLLYSGGSSGDVFAVELLDGVLCLVLQHGRVYKREEFSTRRLNNGEMHTLTVTFRSWGAAVTMDGLPKTVTVGDVDAKALNLTGHLYLGGLDYTNSNLQLNPHVYTAALHQGYVGCVHSVKVNGKLQKLEQLARDQRVAIGNQCVMMRDRCAEDTCRNGGVCQEGWNRATCECTNTDQTGDSCEMETMPAQFNGSQHFTATNISPRQTATEEFVIKFRTKLAYGIVLTTKSELAEDSFSVLLYETKLIIRYVITGYEQVVNIGEKLNDGAWHVIKVNRQGKQVKTTLDNSEDFVSVLEDIDDSLLLSIDSMRLGSQYTQTVTNIAITVEDISTIPGFIGHIQYLRYNGVVYLSNEEVLESYKNREYTCQFTTEQVEPIHVVSTKTDSSIVIQTQPAIKSPMNSLNFWFKFNDDSGLLLYAPLDDSFFGLELLQGRLRMFYGAKNATAPRLTSRLLSNNTWHYLSIVVLSDGKVHTMVNDVSYTSLLGVGSTGLMFSEINVAGLNRPQSYMSIPVSMLSSNSFIGCIGTFELNGARPNLLSMGRKGVTSGCKEVSRCFVDSCSNGGQCITTDNYERRCLCHMTTFKGPTCSREGTSFMFGEDTIDTDMLVYEYPEPYDTYNDSLTFGIQTTEPEAMLIRVLSANSGDFTEVMIRQGKMYVESNIGGEDWPVANGRDPVNDGKYHVIRLRRQSSSMFLQLDNKEWSNSTAPDEVLSVFNSITKVQIGGDLQEGSRIEDGYIGKMTGLVFNELSLFDIPENLKTYGQVRNLNNPRPPKTEPVQTPRPITDDDLVKLEGSGYNTDCAEEDNSPDCQTESDELIIPTTILKEDTTTRAEKPSNRITIKTILPMRSRPPETNFSFSSDNVTTKDGLTLARGLNPGPVVELEVTSPSSGYIDIEKHLPLIAGISGGALLTLILIAIIACRLTRNPKKKEYKPANIKDPDPGVTATPRVTDDTNGSIANGNGHAGTNTKEWYV